MNLEDMVIASVDDHVIEPPTMFDQHLSKEHRALAPQYVTDELGNASWWWEHENKRTFAVGINAVVGRPKEEYGMEPMNIDQMRKGVWDAAAHIDDMNAMGQMTALMFPTFAGFDGSWFWDAKDKENTKRVMRAYNDWHIDEWCGPYQGRYFPTGLLPLWDLDATLAEMKRLVKKGCRSVFFPANPASRNRLASVHDPLWEPMWALANDEGIVFNCHIGTGLAPEANSDLSPISAWITAMPMAIATDAADLLHLKALLRYPNLKFALSEGGIGWVPYMLERADFTFRHHGPWVRVDFGGKLPSEVFREHFLTCFIDDRFGCENYKSVGEDIIAYECDYPHSDCTWPHVAEDLWDNVKDLPQNVIDKITHQNAYRFYGVDPVAQLGRENCTVGALRAKATHVDISVQSKGGKDAREYAEAGAAVTAGNVAKTFVPVVTAGDVAEGRKRRKGLI
jgi:predicted TIM-barrel fold metal-dependent hydrolase